MASNVVVDIFRIPELRRRALFTLFLLIVFRLGALIPIPGVNISVIKAAHEAQRQAGDGFAFSEYLDFFSGGAFSNYSLLMLGIMPYISAQIIMQVLTLVFPLLKRLLEEDGGRRKFQKYVRIGTVLVATVQGIASASGALNIENGIAPGLNPMTFMFIAVLSIIAGTMFLVWIGEQITQRGIGNGTSLLIFTGIVARIPSSLTQLVVQMRLGTLNPVLVLAALVLFAFIIYLVVFEQQGERKIPVNYAKRIVGRQMMQAQSSYIPFKINPSGVIPIIFASSILTFPLQILGPIATPGSTVSKIVMALSFDGVWYNVIYALLIVFFAYFYTQVSLNPIEVSRQIREHGGNIPGVRSENMEMYLQGILNRIILPGALFLAVIAILPTLVVQWFGLPMSVAQLLGGTSLLIIVGVDLDTMNQIEGHLKMHQHDGITTRSRSRRSI
ncbi:MAG: preprotein translocase subunit SecY [Spirochaetia bacterium]